MATDIDRYQYPYAGSNGCQYAPVAKQVSTQANNTTCNTWVSTRTITYIYIYIYICTSVDAFEHPLVYDWISLRVSVDGH